MRGRRSLARRAFLAGATPVLAGLFDRRRARAADAPVAPPRRLLVWAHLEGNIAARFSPTGGETDFQLPGPLRPLEPWRSRLLVLDGLHSVSGIEAARAGVDGHAAALSSMLTGRADFVQRPFLPSRTTASIDQAVAAALRGPARLRSVEMRVDAACATHININYPVPEGPPLVTPFGDEGHFDRLFGDVAAAETPAGRRAAVRRASVLDYLRGELSQVARAAGKENAHRIDAHLEAVRDIERRLAWRKPARCALPARPANILDRNRIPEATKLRLDMLIQAFACDVTRVATFALCDSGWNVPAPFLQIGEPLHGISHGLVASAVPWPEAGRRIMRWSYEQMAYLLRGLEAIPEGDGTVLDNTLILSIGEFGDSAVHSAANLPIVIVGDGWKYFRSGRALRFAGEPHNDVLVSIANALGVPLTTFGDPRLSRGPMARLRG